MRALHLYLGPYDTRACCRFLPKLQFRREDVLREGKGSFSLRAMHHRGAAWLASFRPPAVNFSSTNLGAVEMGREGQFSQLHSTALNCTQLHSRLIFYLQLRCEGKGSFFLRAMHQRGAAWLASDRRPCNRFLSQIYGHKSVE